MISSKEYLKVEDATDIDLKYYFHKKTYKKTKTSGFCCQYVFLSNRENVFPKTVKINVKKSSNCDIIDLAIQEGHKKMVINMIRDYAFSEFINKQSTKSTNLELDLSLIHI